MDQPTQGADVAQALQSLSSLHRRQRIINLACALNMLRVAVHLDTRQPIATIEEGAA